MEEQTIALVDVMCTCENILLISHLINSKGKDLEIAICSNMESSERLVVCNSERGEGFIKVYMKPVNADV